MGKRCGLHIFAGMTKGTLYLLLSLTLCCILPLSGQDEYVRFKRITINDGLSLSSVYCIYQDSKGFMWFGTEDGLNKYDGQSITVYGATTDQHYILADKWIEEIYEDKTGMIWLGSKGGLTKYNPRKGIFTPIQHDPESSFSLSNDTVTAIGTDLQNELWVGTVRGLNRVNRITNEVERIIPGEKELSGLTSRITGFLQDDAGIFWIASYQGLYSYDTKSGLFFRETAGGIIHAGTRIHSMHHHDDAIWIGSDARLFKLDLSGARQHKLFSPEFGNPDAEITNLLVDRLDQVWMQTNEGLYCFRPSEGLLRKVISPAGVTHSLAINPFKPLLEDGNGFIWCGTFGNGVFRIDPSTLNSDHYLHNPADPQSISENSINCIFEDRSGGLWFGTFGAGISILDPLSNRFTLFKSNPFDPNSLVSSFIWTVFEASDGKIWLGTDAHGISVYDPRRGIFTHYDHDPDNPRSLSGRSIRKIYQDSRGRIWIGTDGGGLNLFRPGDKSFIHFLHDRQDPLSISDNSVRAIYEDRQGNLWVGTRNGLNLFDPESGSFRRYLHDPADPASLPNNFIYSAIYQDHGDNLWIGTYGSGLCKMDPRDGTCISYTNDPDDPTTISDNIVFAIYEDETGRFWIGTNSGLNMFYPATGSFRRFGVGEGLANEVIYGILPDDSRHIWMSSNLGIMRFNLETFEVKNFDMNDGLQSNEFNGGAYHRGNDGKLYFGGVYGLNVIDPSEIEPVRDVPNVTLTKLEVLGKEVKIAGVDLEEAFEDDPDQILEHEGEYYVSENVTYKEEIILDYRHRFFSIEFSALNSLRPGKLNYSYIMQNLETEWNNAGTRNYVSYANMRAGTYLLKVVAENADGYRSNPPLQLRITIKPPYWMSWWFILLEVLAVSSIAVLIYTYLVKSRTNRLLKYQNQQISIANKALRESEQNLKELNATKDKFFSIISHDLKNPFSSLLSISELMVENFDATDREDHRAGFQKIHQSIQHLLTLLENLLTWSRSQRGKIKYDPVRFNLTTLIRENINLHRILAEKKSIMLHYTETDEVYAYGDRDMINSVIRNLVTNAVKFTGPEGKVEVKVHTRDAHIEVSVMDEGIGISAENLNRLFRIDEKFKSTGTAGEKGTGLGLIICREFVEMHGGEIRVRSKPSEGSTFSFTIPKAN